MMTAKQKISMAIAYAGITQAELAKRLGQSPQQFYQRLNTGKFTMVEWNDIAEALGAKFEMQFIFDDNVI